MKYGLAYIPTVGRLNTFMHAFYRAFQKAQLNQVSRIEMTFDPFTGKQAESLRLTFRSLLCIKCISIYD